MATPDGSPPRYGSPSPPATHIPPPPFAYQMPAYWAPPVYVPEAPSANTALILGLVAFPGALVMCLLGFVGIGGIIYGGRARKEIAQSGGVLRGKDKAILGIVFGWIGIAVASLYVVAMVVLVIFIATTEPGTHA